jgi:5-methylcytosine-specific restriction protein A
VGGKGSGHWGLRNWPANGREFVSVNSITIPEEMIGNQMYQEGAKKQILVNIYERNDTARRKCIQHHGLKCFICDFDFQEKYGDIGLGFIHVHHLQPLSAINEEYELDPIRDLRPVCPNCHAMIHRRNPPYTLEEMKDILQTRLWVD